MEVSDRDRWDEKYRRLAVDRAPDPDPFFLRVLRWIAATGRIAATGSAPAGARALDLAAGRGRHAIPLARRGWDVEAWDVSPVGLAQLERHAEAAGVRVATRAVDLVGDAPPATRAFDLVVAIDFLHRPLVAELPRLVVPGGWLCLATFTTERPGSRPPLRYCLEPGELERGIEGFETLRVTEDAGRAGILARRLPLPGN